MPKQPKPKWTCGWCRKVNEANRFTCECGKPKPKKGA
jgi:hypothetical protein